MSNRILVVTQQGEARFLTTESTPTRVITIQPTGARGIPGTNGAGVAAGGSANDILKKTNSTDYVTEWETPTDAATSNAIVRRDGTGGAFFGGDVGAPKYRGNFYQAESATDGASLRNSSGTAILTWGATAGNISITVDTTSTGHFFSNPGTATAGHFLTKNGTTPTIVAGRSAWFSDSSGSPQFKNGTSSAITLIYSGGPLGTPSSGTLTNCTDLPIGTGVSGLGTSIATALAINLNTAGSIVTTNSTVTLTNKTLTSPTLTTPALGTPTSGTLTNCTGLPVSGGISGMGTGVATLLQGIPTGSSGIVGPNTPTLISPLLGTPTSGTLTNCTGLPVTTGVSGLGTGVATLLTGTPSGTGGPVGTTSPTLGGTLTVAQASNAIAAKFTAPNTASDLINLQSTSATGYSSLGFYDENNAAKGSFGYSNNSAGAIGDKVFFSAVSVPMVFSTNQGTTSHVSIATSGGVSIGTTTDAGATNLLVAGTAKANGGFIYGTYTVGTFPSTTYLEAVVTDALSPVIGAAVAAGGSAKCKVMYNGSAKIVTAVL